MIKRIIDFHLNNWLNDPYRKPLLLRGARQVGKTYAVRQLAKQVEQFVEINFERQPEAIAVFEKDLHPERIIRDLSLFTGMHIVPGKTLLFLDEIQAAPNAIISLRYFYELMPDLHLIAAGSLLDFAIEQVGLPVGRVSLLHMYPLSFIEYLVATDRALIAQAILDHPIGTPINEPIHTKILDIVGEYLSIGGMPEAVKRWHETKDLAQPIRALQEIAATYRQDFEKYGRKSQIKYLEQLFRQIPYMVGNEFAYKEIHGEYRKRELAPALNLLEKANVIHKIFHTAGQGIPIGADINFEIFKVIFLDVALCQIILGSDISPWFLRPLETFSNRGEIAESFVGQELVCYAAANAKAELYFWKRNEKNSTAEVDYLVQQNEQIIPIEVKSGHGKTLRSMHLFLETHRHSSKGIRFSTLNYSIIEHLDSRPLYAVATLAHSSQQQALRSLF